MATITEVVHPPTDADTLHLYKPAPNSSSAAINELLLTHPIAVALRSDPDTKWIESRPHMKIPAAMRARNLTAGALSGEGRIVCPPVAFQAHIERVVARSAEVPTSVSSSTTSSSAASVTSADSSPPSPSSPTSALPPADLPQLVSLQYLGADLCGHPGIVHGGLSATLLDEGLARCCFPALPNKIGVTASLNISYKRPVLAEQVVILRARTTRVEGRKVWVEGQLEDAQGNVLVGAEALFVEPRGAATMAKLSSTQ